MPMGVDNQCFNRQNLMVTTNDIVCYPLQLTYENKYTPTHENPQSGKFSIQDTIHNDTVSIKRYFDLIHIF